jgi:hypothetical protein
VEVFLIGTAGGVLTVVTVGVVLIGNDFVSFIDSFISVFCGFGSDFELLIDFSEILSFSPNIRLCALRNSSIKSSAKGKNFNKCIF